VAGLQAFRQVLSRFTDEFATNLLTLENVDELIERGCTALAQILPNECIQPGKERDSDGALLFLIYPLQIADEAIAIDAAEITAIANANLTI
jgi:hypothetical protein